MKKTVDFQEYHLKNLQDTQVAKQYLEIALEEYEVDGDTEAFLLALRDVAEAQGGLGRLAKLTELNRQNLYKILSGQSKPRIDTISLVLHALGFKLSIKPLK